MDSRGTEMIRNSILSVFLASALIARLTSEQKIVGTVLHTYTKRRYHANKML
jgi:hypothetical protein